MRIAVLGLQHETNTFLESTTSLSDFEQGSAYGSWRWGDQLLEQARGGHPVPITGFVRRAWEYGWTLLPIFWAFAEPGGIVERGAFESMMGRIEEELRPLLPLDGIYLDLHGAMVVDGIGDGEGEMLRRLRHLAGETLSIVASLDLHGNVTQEMADLASAMVAYRTYPHVDNPQTGRRAADLMKEILLSGPLAKAFIKLPVMLPLHRQTTLVPPGRTIYQKLEDIEQRHGVHSLSFLPGFPPSDVPECGPSVLAYASDHSLASEAAEALARSVLDREADFDPDLPDAAEAVRQALRWHGAKPALIADVQDNPGGGGTGDTVWILAELLRQGARDATVGMIFDPAAAELAARTGIGKTATFSLGGKLMSGHTPLLADFGVVALTDEPVVLTGNAFGGLRIDLGQVALLTRGGTNVVVASRRVQCLDPAFFQHAGIDPASQRILVVKSTNHYRADLEPLAGTIIEAACPGACIMDPSTLPYKHLRPGVRLRPGAK